MDEGAQGTQPLARVRGLSHDALRHALICLFAVVGDRGARAERRAALAADDAMKARRVQ